MREILKKEHSKLLADFLASEKRSGKRDQAKCIGYRVRKLLL